MWIRTQLFISMRIRIRIQEAKPMQIHADPDSSQTLSHKKLHFCMTNILEVGKVQKTFLKAEVYL
jgi:hypothetical protein